MSDETIEEHVRQLGIALGAIRTEMRRTWRGRVAWWAIEMYARWWSRVQERASK